MKTQKEYDTGQPSRGGGDLCLAAKLQHYLLQQ